MNLAFYINVLVWAAIVHPPLIMFLKIKVPNFSVKTYVIGASLPYVALLLYAIQQFVLK